MTIEEVAQKVVDGGYLPQYMTMGTTGDRQRYLMAHGFRAEDYLSPAFWQAFGKAMGWCRTSTEWFCSDCKQRVFNEMFKFCSVCGKPLKESTIYLSEEWKGEWHRFIDHLAEGKTPESFFEQFTS